MDELFSSLPKAEAQPRVEEKEPFSEKAMDFLFPTTKDVFGEFMSAVKGEEVPQRGFGEQIRRGVGTGLELSSFLPTYRLATTATLPFRTFIKGIFTRGVVATGRQAVKGGAEQIGKRSIRSLMKEGAVEGGVAGTLFEGGQAIADKDADLTEILTRAGVGGLYGTAGGAVALPVLNKTLSGVGNLGSRVAGRVGGDIDQIVKTASKGIYESLVDSRTGQFSRLDKVNARFSRSLGEMEPEELIEEMLREGYMPDVTGDIARTNRAVKTNNSVIANLSEAVTRLVSKSPQSGKRVISLQEFNDLVREAIAKNPTIDQFKAVRQFRAEMKFIKDKYGDNLTPEAMDELRRRANKAGSKGTPVADVNSEVGRVTRQLLDEIDPDIRRLNAEAQRLLRVRATLQALNNQKINTGYISSFVGRLMATQLAGLAGLGGFVTGGFATGGGALVIAGAIATGGAKLVSHIIRNARFNPNLLKAVRRTLRTNQKLLKEILDEADPEDKVLIEKAMGFVEQPDGTLLDRFAETPGKKKGALRIGRDVDPEITSLNKQKEKLSADFNKKYEIPYNDGDISDKVFENASKKFQAKMDDLDATIADRARLNKETPKKKVNRKQGKLPVEAFGVAPFLAQEE